MNFALRGIRPVQYRLIFRLFWENLENFVVILSISITGEKILLCPFLTFGHPLCLPFKGENACDQLIPREGRDAEVPESSANL